MRRLQCRLVDSTGLYIYPLPLLLWCSSNISESFSGIGVYHGADVAEYIWDEMGGSCSNIWGYEAPLTTTSMNTTLVMRELKWVSWFALSFYFTWNLANALNLSGWCRSSGWKIWEAVPQE
jgi:hypothetical protein